MSEKFYTVKQIAKLLHREPETIRAWVKAGKIVKSPTIGGPTSKILIPVTEIEEKFPELKEPETDWQDNLDYDDAVEILGGNSEN